MREKQQLPIYECVADIRDALKATNRLVISAPTGSGKSTQVPQILLDDAGVRGQVVVLQPRRLAARMLARRVAWERDGRCGDEVGYQVRFDHAIGPRTRIRYVTEGILMRELVGDSSIPGVGAVVFDEFHERHLFGDVTLAMIRRLQETVRPDLRIVVMSATLELTGLEAYLEGCRTIVSQGRSFPVEVCYLERKVDLRRARVWEVAADALAQHLPQAPRGNVLVFMPGGYEIRKTVEAVKRVASARGMPVYALHGELPPEQQDEAVAGGGPPRIVVATNVAETSITIEGVTLVIDSGLVRMARYDARRGIDSLLVENISQASAEQRRGRAGRTVAGRCVRLWTEHEQRGRAPHTLPEIMRNDLSEIVLALKEFGVEDVRAFPWFESPEPHALDHALEFLVDVGALDEEGEITEDGRRMLAFPVHPRYARMLLEAQRFNCVRETALLAALLQGRDILLGKVGKAVEQEREKLFGEETESDLFFKMRAWWYACNNGFDRDACDRVGIHAGAARTVQQIFRNFVQVARRIGLEISEDGAFADAVRQCLMTGLIDRLACRVDSGTLRCRLVHGRTGTLSRSSRLRDARLFVAADIAEIEGGGREINVLLNEVTAVKEEWLQTRFASAWNERQEAFWDAGAKRVRRRRLRCFRDLTLEETVDDRVSPDAACAILAGEIRSGNIRLAKWNKDVDQWIERVNCLAAWCPDWNIPPIDGEAVEAILQSFCLGAFNARDLKDRSVLNAFKRWLNGAQVELVEKMMPVKLMLPSGRRARIRYDRRLGAVASATIQDLYGLEQSPKIAGGRVALKMEILAPNQRPVQVTDDMASFWKNQYPAVKKELQRKYHKHEWR